MHLLYVGEELDNELFLHTTLLQRDQQSCEIVMFRILCFLLLPSHSPPTDASDRQGNTHNIA